LPCCHRGAHGRLRAAPATPSSRYSR
jgi:hypothetical protein